MSPQLRIAIVAAFILAWFLLELRGFHRERDRARRRDFHHITATRRWWRDKEDGPEGDH